MLAFLVRGVLLVGLIVAATAAHAHPIRLHFRPGSFGVIAHNRVTLRVFQRQYMIAARAGQTMILSFTGQGPMRGSVACRGGGDGPFYGSGNTFVVPATGFCIINVGANPMASDWKGRFTMAVLLSRPGHALKQIRAGANRRAAKRRSRHR